MHTQPRQPAGPGASGGGAAAALAEIKRRQDRVIRTVLVPVWYWWVMAAGMVAIGVARDNGSTVVQATTIPIAALVMAGLTARTIPAVRRRVQVHATTQPGARGAAAIFALIVLVDVAVMATAASLAAAHDPNPGTIGTAAGAAVLVIGGPLVNRYLGALMLSNARQQTSRDARQAGSQNP
jgi:peptidoglycan/LPS O-acetylase OafA/YrhL